LIGTPSQTDTWEVLSSLKYQLQLLAHTWGKAPQTPLYAINMLQHPTAVKRKRLVPHSKVCMLGKTKLTLVCSAQWPDFL